MVPKAINWKQVEEQLDIILKHTVALKIGMTDAESLLRRFTKTTFNTRHIKPLQNSARPLKPFFIEIVNVYLPISHKNPEER